MPDLPQENGDANSALGLVGAVVFRVDPEGLVTPQNQRAMALVDAMVGRRADSDALFGRRLEMSAVGQTMQWSHVLQLADGRRHELFWELTGDSKAGWLCVAVQWQPHEVLKNTLHSQTQFRRHLSLKAMPRPMAQRLRGEDVVRPRAHRNASVLVASIVDFPAILDALDPVTMLSRLDRYFSALDAIVQRANLFKVRSEHGHYLCLAGIPDGRPSHPVELVLAACAMRDAAAAIDLGGHPSWRLKFGIHSGPVVTGCVGDTPQFDVWGNSVTLARAIEEQAEPQQVLVSQETAALTRDFFELSRPALVSLNDRTHRLYTVVGPHKSLATSSNRAWSGSRFMEAFFRAYYPDSETVAPNAEGKSAVSDTLSRDNS